jgi:hypothetical protein
VLHKSGKLRLFGVLFGCPAHGFLDFAGAFLHFSLDLAAGVSGGGTRDVVRFAFDLLHFSGGDIFTGHNDLLVKANMHGAKQVPGGGDEGGRRRIWNKNRLICGEFSDEIVLAFA